MNQFYRIHLMIANITFCINILTLLPLRLTQDWAIPWRLLVAMLQLLSSRNIFSLTIL